MRPFARFSAALLLLAASGEGPLEPGPYTLQGSWLGSAYPVELALDLQQDRDFRVTGTGEIRALREVLETVILTESPLVLDTTSIDTVIEARVPVQVAGTWDYADFTLALRVPDYADVLFDGRFRDTTPDSIAGTLRESGFEARPITIVRQPASVLEP